MLNIDWNTCSAADGKRGGCKKILIAADWVPIMDSQKTPIYDRVMSNEPEKCYGGVLDVLNRADLRVFNLECAINGKKPVIKSGPHLLAADRHMPCLKAGKADIVTLANNHVFDYGVEGYLSTCRALDELGILHYGAGLDDREAWTPLVYDLDGVKIGFVSFTEGHDFTAAAPGKPGVAGWDVGRARSAIRDLKGKCDVVIVIPHAGIEYAAHPSMYCIDAYRELAAEKPDAIVAHHPHVPQGLEIRDGVPIFYSLGNFMFHMGTSFHYRRHGFMVELELDRQGLHGFRIYPFFIADHGLELLNGESAREFGNLLRKLSRPFDGGDPYAGINGFFKLYWHNDPLAQFRQAVDLFATDPLWAAAMIRNRTTTLQHVGLHLPMIERAISGKIDDVPAWSEEMEREYMIRVIK